MGGTFCRFQVGRTGKSAHYLRYILRTPALGSGPPGIWTRHLPEEVTGVADPDLLARNLLAYGWLVEVRAQAAYPEDRGRTHYRAMVSFETPLEEAVMGRLMTQWLEACFPRQPAIAVLHRNTAFRHIHLWIAARDTQGRQLNLRAAAYRQLDERWNRLYAPAVGRDEREHLLQKWNWEARKQAYRETLQKQRLPPQPLPPFPGSKTRARTLPAAPHDFKARPLATGARPERERDGDERDR
jgi:hypothetical protein